MLSTYAVNHNFMSQLPYLLMYGRLIAAMLRNVIVFRRRAHTPAIYEASHVGYACLCFCSYS